MKKMVISALAVLLMTNMSMGQVIRYKSSGNWTETTNNTANARGWQKIETFNILPETNNICRGNWGNNLVTLTNAQTIGAIQWGVDETSRLLITGTGNLTVLNNNTNTAPFSSGMGFGGGFTSADLPATLTIESNGVLNVNTNWVMGNTDAGVGGSVTMDIKAGGTMTVAGAYIQNNANVIGFTKVSGTLNVDTLTLGNARILNIDGQAAKLVIASDATAQIEGYIANGTLLGNMSVSNVFVEVTTNETTGVTNTIITAKLPAVPNYVGLDVVVASTKIVTDGFSVGDLTSNYVRGVVSGTVLSQNPLAGDIQTPSGSPIDLTHQEIAPLTTNNTVWAGSVDALWTNDANWGPIDNVAPVRETQSLKARIVDPTVECVLNASVGVAWLEINGGNLKLVNGADLLAGKLPLGGSQWTGVGYQSPSSLTIEEGAKMETAGYLITGFSSTLATGVSTINLNGGDLTVGGNIQMGNIDLQSSATINVSSGSVLRCEYFNFRDAVSNGTYSVVHMYDGQIIQNLNQTNVLQQLIIDGGIKIHSPAYSISVVSNKAVLQTLDIGFGSWAAQWGVAIGAETEDFDNDGFSNLYEYAMDGNPTNNVTGGQEPVIAEEGGVLTFTFRQRNDDPKLTYSVETTDSLTTGTWEAVGYTTESSRVADGKYDVVTHTIPVTDAKKFVRLKVSQTL